MERFPNFFNLNGYILFTVGGFQRKLLEGSRLLARGHYRTGVQVGPETHQRVNREVKTGDADISSSIQKVYYHFGGRLVTIRIAGGWGRTHRQLANLVGGLPCWQHCSERCAGRRHQIKKKIRSCLSLLQSWARFRFPFLRPRVNHPYTFPLITRWNYPASYVGIPTVLEDTRLLLDQWLEAQFQWTPYDDSVMRATDRVLRQFEFQQPILEEPEVLDEQHKIDLRLTNTNWSLFWPEYIEIWENWYDYILDREPIIIPELACTPDYMPWFRIHGKPYLLSEEQRRRQIRVKRERRSPLNLRRRDDSTGLSTAPTQSSSPMSQPTTPTSQPLQIMSSAYLSPYMYPNLHMFPFSSPMPGWNAWLGVSHFSMTPTQPMIYRSSSPQGSHEAPSGGSFNYHSPSPYGIQTPLPWVIQTPPHSLFYQDGHPLNTHNQSNHNSRRSNHNPLQSNYNSRRSNQVGTQHVIVVYPHVALILTGIYIDLFLIYL
ncbi:hypothetical protein CXB51_020704 [Gossypium anomalum]|uniref:Aminotransferase-like plant mobile domain-containing protein n=1 Tax=Gossypium anomalum TaxID=47600 RepID=A0A8J6CXE3_9ROSI|nr:hypothetical protein CXB51_020704 [Gossypium anomalum]